MTEARLRDMGGSQQSLRQAIGQLDGAETPRAGHSRPTAERVAPTRHGRWWVVLIVLGLVSAAAAAGLLAS